MVDKRLYITKHKIAPSADYNYWLKCLDTELFQSTNKNLLKVLQVVEPTNKTFLYNLGTSVINSLLSSPFLPNNTDLDKSFRKDSGLDFE